MDNKIKVGEKVQISSLDFGGYLVAKYRHPTQDRDVYVVCNVKLDAPKFAGKNFDDALQYIESLPKNIRTELECKSVILDSPEEMQKVV